MKYWNRSPGSHCSPAAKFNQSSGHERFHFYVFYLKIQLLFLVSTYTPESRMEAKLIKATNTTEYTE